MNKLFFDTVVDMRKAQKAYDKLPDITNKNVKLKYEKLVDNMIKEIYSKDENRGQELW